MKVTEQVLKKGCNHIFAWPFKFYNENQDTKKHRKKPQKRKDQIMGIKREMVSYGWIPKALSDISQHGNEFSVNIDKSKYMLYQYLSGSSRDIFMDKDEKVCAIYEYPKEVIDNLIYYIRCSDGTEFRIPFVSIELHMYNHGIGIMFLHLMNTEYTTLEEIKLINDLGRRVLLPYIPSTEKEGILCAEELGVIYKSLGNKPEEKCTKNYRKMVEEVYASKSDKETIEQTLKELKEPASFLSKLLHGYFIDGKDKNLGVIASDLTDDRMFVICVIRNSYVSNKIKSLTCLEDDPKLLERLYEIMYIDKDIALCRNEKMREALMQEALYMRWSGWGTIYGVTNYSFVCVTTEKSKVNDSVVTPMIAEYAYMISLVLAQRLGITMFSEASGKVVIGVEEKGNISKDKVKDLINLQEQYITFKNQLLVLEVTKQEQGIELYRLMQKQLLIYQLEEVLDEQLESLYEVTNVSNGNRIGGKEINLALSAIAVDILVNILAIILG